MTNWGKIAATAFAAGVLIATPVMTARAAEPLCFDKEEAAEGARWANERTMQKQLPRDRRTLRLMRDTACQHFMELIGFIADDVKSASPGINADVSLGVARYAKVLLLRAAIADAAAKKPLALTELIAANVKSSPRACFGIKHRKIAAQVLSDHNHYRYLRSRRDLTAMVRRESCPQIKKFGLVARAGFMSKVPRTSTSDLIDRLSDDQQESSFSTWAAIDAQLNREDRVRPQRPVREHSKVAKK